MPARLIEDMKGNQFSKETNAYFWQTTKYNNVSEEEEKALAKEMKNGSVAARERLVNSQLEHVIVVACDHYYRDKDRFGECIMSLEDLCCEGNFGLLYAVEKFDPEKGRWPSYAKFWIERYVLEALNKRRAEVFSNTNHGKKRSEDETLIPIQSIEAFEQKNWDNSNKSIEELAVEKVPSPEEVFLRESFKEGLDKQIQFFLRDFKERDRTIFNMYFGLAGQKEKSEKEIGQEFGLSENQVKRVIKLIQRKLYSKEIVQELKS